VKWVQLVHVVLRVTLQMLLSDDPDYLEGKEIEVNRAVPAETVFQGYLETKEILDSPVILAYLALTVGRVKKVWLDCLV